MPDTIGKYRILEPIGRGGMGTIFKAHDPILDRAVALKVISGQLEVTAELRARFFREAKACARLSHPSIVTIHEMGEDDGQLFIVMELLQGEELRALIARRQELLLVDKLAIVEQVCEALHHAHQMGIVHRDIKPANIFLLRNGRVKLLDFGIARLAETESGLTRTGLIMGTLRYMAPEQLQGRADARSDIFSVGSVCYEFLSLRPPFNGEDMVHILEQIRTADPPPLDAIDPAIPSALATIVRRAMRKEPAERFGDLEEMRVALEEVRRGIASEAQRRRSELQAQQAAQVMTEERPQHPLAAPENSVELVRESAAHRTPREEPTSIDPQQTPEGAASLVNAGPTSWGTGQVGRVADGPDTAQSAETAAAQAGSSVRVSSSAPRIGLILFAVLGALMLGYFGFRALGPNAATTDSAAQIRRLLQNAHDAWPRGELDTLLRQLVAARARSGDIDGARESARLAPPTSMDLAFNLATLGAELGRAGRTADALAACKEALTVGEGPTTRGEYKRYLRRMIGDCYAETGDATAARQFAAQVSEHKPEAFLSLAEIFTRNGRREDAEAVMREATKLSEGNTDAMESVGQSLARMGAVDAALRIARSLPQTNRLSLLAEIGERQIKAGDRGAGVTTLNSVLDEALRVGFKDYGVQLTFRHAAAGLATAGEGAVSMRAVRRIDDEEMRTSLLGRVAISLAWQGGPGAADAVQELAGRLPKHEANSEALKREFEEHSETSSNFRRLGVAYAALGNLPAAIPLMSASLAVQDQDHCLEAEVFGQAIARGANLKEAERWADGLVSAVRVCALLGIGLQLLVRQGATDLEVPVWLLHLRG